jgi:hypothetical protein
MKKQLPLLVGFLTGIFALAEFYIPWQGVHTAQSFLLEIAQVLAAAAFVLGGINVLQVNIPIISRRRLDWQYKLILVASAGIMGLCGIKWHEFLWHELLLSAEPTSVAVTQGAGLPDGQALVRVETEQPDLNVLLDGELVPSVGGKVDKTLVPGEHSLKVTVSRTGYSSYETKFTVAAGQVATARPALTMQWGTEGRVFYWLYDHVFAPANATMFALLAFFIASAAFRAFRARNVEAALLLGAAILVMIGRVPIGRWISPLFPELADWIRDIPNNAGRRAIMAGAALGAIATGLRVILGIERSHLGRD